MSGSLPSDTKSKRPYGSSTPQISDPKFVNPLQENDTCINCKEVLKDAHQISCGHLLCKACIDPYFDSLPDSKTCRAEDCGEEISRNQVYPDRNRQKAIGRLPVYCSFKENGCQNEMPWSELYEHQKTCQFRWKMCEKCSEGIVWNKYDEHLKNTCTYRQIPCQLCGEQLLAKNMPQHQADDCPNAIFECKLGCKQQNMKREEYNEHRNKCPFRIIKCALSTIGCKFEGNEEEIKKHDQECNNKHIEMLFAHIDVTNKKNFEIESTCENFEEKYAQLQHDYNLLKYEYETVKLDIKKFEKETILMKEMLKTIEERLHETQSKINESSLTINLEKAQEEVKNLRAIIQLSDTRLSELSTTGTPAAVNKSMEEKLKMVERQHSLHDMRISELGLRCQILETASYNGVLMWKINDYYNRKLAAKEGRTISLFSQPFYTSRHGYKMCARVYLNGDGQGRNTHLSLFFVVMRGDYDNLLPWPFRQRVTMMVLSFFKKHQKDSFVPDKKSNSFQKPTSEMNIASGVPSFISHQKLETSEFIDGDNCLYIKVQVDIAGLSPIELES